MGATGTGRRLKLSHMGSAYYRPCCHCRRMSSVENLSLDHILPKSKGGRLTKKNTTLACKPCNMERGTEDFWVFRQRKRVEVLGRIVDTSTESPTREEWERAHAKSGGFARAVRPDLASLERRKLDESAPWWLEYREPTPKDPL